MEAWREELYSSELYHHGIKGQKWGVRRFQKEDGTLTAAGKARLKSNNTNNQSSGGGGGGGADEDPLADKPEGVSDEYWLEYKSNGGTLEEWLSDNSNGLTSARLRAMRDDQQWEEQLYKIDNLKSTIANRNGTYADSLVKENNVRGALKSEQEKDRLRRYAKEVGNPRDKYGALAERAFKDRSDKESNDRYDSLYGTHAQNVAWNNYAKSVERRRKKRGSSLRSI